jgi:nanoRNase/pAp phosphatase (c-di-AMP/oligoRNAs hydrolase)
LARKREVATDGHHALQLLTHLAQRGSHISPLLILTHDYPDPDALASAWGLQVLAREFGIDSRIVYGGVVTRAENRAMMKLLKLPAHRLRPGELSRARHVALVDTQPAFENNPFPENRRATLVIDQHRPAERTGADLALVDPDCGATCVIVAQALFLKQVAIPPSLATALAYGILSDTLDLFRVQRDDVIQTYLRVLRRADMRALAEIQNSQRSRRFFATLSRGLRAAVVCRRVVVAHLGPVSGPEDVAHVADFLLTYDRADWSLCTGRLRGSLCLSLRTEVPGADASPILRRVVNNPALAGGHGGVAGGRINVGRSPSDADWRREEKHIQDRLASELDLPSDADFRRAFV